MHVGSQCSSTLEETSWIMYLRPLFHSSNESTPYLCGRESVWIMGAEEEEGIGRRYGGSGKKILNCFFFFVRHRCDGHYLNHFEVSRCRFILSSMTTARNSHPQLPLRPWESKSFLPPVMWFNSWTYLSLCVSSEEPGKAVLLTQVSSLSTKSWARLIQFLSWSLP